MEPIALWSGSLNSWYGERMKLYEWCLGLGLCAIGLPLLGIGYIAVVKLLIEDEQLGR